MPDGWTNTADGWDWYMADELKNDDVFILFVYCQQMKHYITWAVVL